MVLAVKLLVLVFGALAFQSLADQPLELPRGFFTIWNRWDAPHYITLATKGYGATEDLRPLIVFFPLYPWTIAIVNMVVRDALLAAFLVSTVASLVAAVLLYRLAALDESRERALLAVWFMFIFPTSYFLHIGYTESLFLALALCAFLAARLDRWWLAGVLGALACLTRINGLILMPALGVEALYQLYRTRRWNWQWLWLGLIGVGFLGYLALNERVLGDPLAFLDIHRDHFVERHAWPWESLREAARSLERRPAEAHTLGVEQWVFSLLGLAGIVASLYWLRPSYTVWMLGSFWMMTNNSFLRSAPRYALVMFPLFILFARLSQYRLGSTIITVWSLLFLGLFAALFVRGWWAF